MKSQFSRALSTIERPINALGLRVAHPASESPSESPSESQAKCRLCDADGLQFQQADGGDVPPAKDSDSDEKSEEDAKHKNYGTDSEPIIITPLGDPEAEKNDRASGAMHVILPGKSFGKCTCGVRFFAGYAERLRALNNERKDTERDAKARSLGSTSYNFCPDGSLLRAWEQQAKPDYSPGDPTNAGDYRRILGRPAGKNGIGGAKGGEIGDAVDPSVFFDADSGEPNEYIGGLNRPLDGCVVRYSYQGGELVPVGVGVAFAVHYYWRCNCLKDKSRMVCNPVLKYDVWGSHGSDGVFPRDPYGRDGEFVNYGLVKPDGRRVAPVYGWVTDKKTSNIVNILSRPVAGPSGTNCCTSFIDVPGIDTKSSTPLDRYLRSEGGKEANRENAYNRERNLRDNGTRPTDFESVIRYGILVRATISATPSKGSECEEAYAEAYFSASFVLSRRKPYKDSAGEMVVPPMEVTSESHNNWWPPA